LLASCFTEHDKTGLEQPGQIRIEKSDFALSQEKTVDSYLKALVFTHKEMLISVHTYDFLKFVGGLWAIEWAWHSAETNLRCARISGICMPNPSIVACKLVN